MIAAKSSVLVKGKNVLENVELVGDDFDVRSLRGDTAVDIVMVFIVVGGILVVIHM